DYSFPALRVDPEHRSSPACQVYESTVIADLAVAKQPRQQGQGVLREDRVDEGRLPLQGFNGATARFRVVVEAGIHNLRIELCRRSQPQRDLRLRWLSGSPRMNCPLSREFPASSQ